jgi:4'-phosphopantetheinyl transferase
VVVATNPPASALESSLLALGREVHLWYVLPDELVDGELLNACRRLLSPDEIERNGRFVFRKDRHRDLVTRALVRSVLSRYRPEVDPASWQFSTNAYGRPEVAGTRQQPPLHFNLSHTDRLIVCLVGRAREIGVDVEHVGRVVLAEDIAERFFSPTEVRDLWALPAEVRRDRFFDLWTLKEAYIKARGLGLQLPLDQFSFHLDTGQAIRISFGPRIRDDPRSWQFSLFRLTTGHRVAVALRRREAPDLAIRVQRTVPLTLEHAEQRASSGPGPDDADRP